MSDSLRPHLGSSVHGIFPGKNTSGVPFPSPEDLSDPRIKPASPMSPALAGGFFTKWSYEGCISLAPLKITKTNDKERLTVNIKNYYT